MNGHGSFEMKSNECVFGHVPFYEMIIINFFWIRYFLCSAYWFLRRPMAIIITYYVHLNWNMIKYKMPFISWPTLATCSIHLFFYFLWKNFEYLKIKLKLIYFIFLFVSGGNFTWIAMAANCKIANWTKFDLHWPFHQLAGQERIIDQSQSMQIIVQPHQLNIKWLVKYLCWIQQI